VYWELYSTTWIHTEETRDSSWCQTSTSSHQSNKHRYIIYNLIILQLFIILYYHMNIWRWPIGGCADDLFVNQSNLSLPNPEGW